jgi:hypothetical protein
LIGPELFWPISRSFTDTRHDVKITIAVVVICPNKKRAACRTVIGFLDPF